MKVVWRSYKKANQQVEQLAVQKFFDACTRALPEGELKNELQAWNVPGEPDAQGRRFAAWLMAGVQSCQQNLEQMKRDLKIQGDHIAYLTNALDEQKIRAMKEKIQTLEDELAVQTSCANSAEMRLAELELSLDRQHSYAQSEIARLQATIAEQFILIGKYHRALGEIEEIE